MNHSRVEVIVESRCEMPPPYWCLLIDVSSLMPSHWCLLLIDESSSSLPPPHKCLFLIYVSFSSMTPPHASYSPMPPSQWYLLVINASSSLVPSSHQIWCDKSQSHSMLPPNRRLLLILQRHHLFSQGVFDANEPQLRKCTYGVPLFTLLPGFISVVFQLTPNYLLV